jgi:hypothetical protein
MTTAKLRCALRRDYVVQSDLEDFLPADKAAEALKALDMDRDGHVSLQDMRDSVLQVRSSPSPLTALVAFC